MTLIPKFNGDEPICEKHNFRGYTCFQCLFEERVKFAKTTALSFATFRDNYKKEELRKVKETELRLGGMITWISASDEKIYEEFLKDKIKER